MQRRRFVLSALGAGAALLVGWGALPPRSRLGDTRSLPVDAGEVALNGWIKIAGDGGVLLAMHRSEMGQGVHVALPMLVADELDLPLSAVQLVHAGADKIYGNVSMFVASLPFHPSSCEPGHESAACTAGRWVVRKLARELGVQVTGGSSSVADSWDVLRLAAATVRAQLVGAAARRWRLPADELVVAGGAVSHSSGPRAHFGELAKEAAATPVSGVEPKAPGRWTLIGRSAARTDSPAKVDGSATFGIDVRLPGMLHAAIRHCPMLGGAPGRADVDALLREPGVVRVVQLASYAGSTAGFAVVAQSHWQAERAARSLRVDWQAPPVPLADSAAIVDRLEREAARDGGFVFHRRGDVEGAEAAAARVHRAVYRAPFLAHATMEPINCTARVKDGKVDVWVSTQVPGFAREIAARVAGVAPEAVSVHVPFLGGGFGRRLEVDAVAQAVRVALETGERPVQLVWSREEDTRHDYYRPAAVALLTAALDPRGEPLGLRIASAADAITPRWIERNLPWLAGPIDLPDKTTSEGLFDLPYGIANQRMSHAATTSGVPVGYWRSVGHSHNAFFSESFIDELAHAARRDPVAFRLGLLSAMPRHAEVLGVAAREAGWGSALDASRARGVALHESFGSIVAQVAEVSLVAGRPRVHRVVCAIDCGVAVNPGIVAQQMESAVVFGLTAALHGRIDIEAGAVRQSNFHDYPLLTVAETPHIETHIVASTRAPAGAGEPGTPPIAPAVANAIHALTGKRLRELPLR